MVVYLGDQIAFLKGNGGKNRHQRKFIPQISSFSGIEVF